jgi:hypothetical protein
VSKVARLLEYDGIPAAWRRVLVDLARSVPLTTSGDPAPLAGALRREVARLVPWVCKSEPARVTSPLAKRASSLV